MAKMSLMLQLLSLCLVTIIQVTSSQPTFDVTEQDSDICSTSGQTDTVLPVLRKLVTAVSRLDTGVTQLQSDVTELKAVIFCRDKIRIEYRHV